MQQKKDICLPQHIPQTFYTIQLDYAIRRENLTTMFQLNSIYDAERDGTIITNS
jgi:hypothetical protein